MDDHQFFSLAFLGSVLLSLFILFDWHLKGAAKAKNINAFKRLILQN
jgi:hypothetical protein